MMSLVLDEAQVCRGLIAMNLQTLELKAFPADAVIMATGGPGLIYGKSTNSMVCTGSAVAACYQQGAKYANGEFIQVHPTSIPGEDKLRLMSESARGEGGRVWVPRNPRDTRPPSAIPENERWYFLEEKFPAYGNLVPRDIATREIFQVCIEGKGVGGENQVFLDLTHIPAETLDRKLGAILEIYEMLWAMIHDRCRCGSSPAFTIQWAVSGLTTISAQTFLVCWRPANATTRSMARTVWALTRW